MPPKGEALSKSMPSGCPRGVLEVLAELVWAWGRGLARTGRRDSEDILAIGGSANLTPVSGVPKAGSFPDGELS